MGAWNHKPFGNDTARDWLWTLEKARNEKFLSRSLKSADDDDEEIAVAAAAVIAAASTEPVGALPVEAKRWVRERGFSPTPKLCKDAARFVRQIARASSLRSRWEESSTFKKWLKELSQLAGTLEKAPAKAAVARKPRAPSVGRYSLSHLIPRIRPADQGPNRAALARKLAALEDVNAFLPGEWQKTALHLLAAQGLLPEVIALVERGAIIDPETPMDGTAATPLELACSRGRAGVVEFLLNRGARVVRETTLPDGHEFTYTPIVFYAAKSGDEATLRLLFDRGFDPQMREMNDRTLLHYAADSDHANMVRFLIAQGLKPNQPDYSQSTPLHQAVMTNRKDCVVALLEAGANPNTRDKYGQSPLDIAREQSHRAVAQILRQHGGV